MNDILMLTTLLHETMYYVTDIISAQF